MSRKDDLVNAAKMKAEIVSVLNNADHNLSLQELHPVLKKYGKSEDAGKAAMYRMAASGLVKRFNKGGGKGRPALYGPMPATTAGESKAKPKTASKAKPKPDKGPAKSEASETPSNIALRINNDGSLTVTGEGFTVTISHE